ncbi:MAG: winged helix-turn-helix domain-containing protein, partial [Gammaproteobacteria bacterium]|nr:winged helix-turn-helix domain-containing protein [Gammaproteobacteria bacterium]
MPEASADRYRFAEFEMDRQAKELYRDGKRVRLQIQPFRVLEMLVEHAGQVVTREELRLRLWPSHVFVDFDRGLNNAVARLREALSDDADYPRFIETLPRVGYRFIVPASQPATAQNISSPAPIRKIWLLPAIAVVAALAIFFFADDREPEHAATTFTVAVLPVRDLSNDGNQDYFAAGITDALITRLSQNAALLVVRARPENTAAADEAAREDIARQLHVDGVVDISLRRQQDMLHMEVRLSRALADGHTWDKQYNEPLARIFELQHRLAEDIVSEIANSMRTPGVSASFVHSANVEAYQLYLQGRHLLNRRSPESVNLAGDYFARAITLDPEFAAAHAGLATAFGLSGGNSLVKSRRLADVYEPALAEARKALELDDRLPEAHVAMALALALAGDIENENAIEEHFETALRLDPALSDAKLLFGNFLSRHGRQQDAIVQYREALLHDPASPNILSRLGKELVDTGMEQEGLQLLERAVEIEPWQFNSHIRLGWIYAVLGRLDEADASFARAEQISGGTAHDRAGRAYVAAKRGDAETAQKLLDAVQLESGDIELPFLVAMVYVARHDRENALLWLEKAAPLSAHSL